MGHWVLEPSLFRMSDGLTVFPLLHNWSALEHAWQEDGLLWLRLLRYPGDVTIPIQLWVEPESKMVDCKDLGAPCPCDHLLPKLEEWYSRKERLKGGNGRRSQSLKNDYLY